MDILDQKIVKTFPGKVVRKDLTAMMKGYNSIKSKIVEIQAFDSPGFTEDFVTSQNYLDMEDKIVKFVPEESMIGMLLSNTDSYRIVKSDIFPTPYWTALIFSPIKTPFKNYLILFVKCVKIINQ